MHLRPFIVQEGDGDPKVWVQLANGFNNTEVARRLHLSVGTVRNYISAIHTKLKMSDRTQAVILAIQYGLDKA